MKCPHCCIDFHDNWKGGFMYCNGYNDFVRDPNSGDPPVFWSFRTARCPACNGISVGMGLATGDGKTHGAWRIVHPIAGNRGPVSPDVPKDIAADYVEACNVLPISAKASAALSRRCLQNILRQQNYVGKDLNAEIDLLLKEVDPIKAIPRRLRETIDAIRNFGNFSAHPINDKTALQVIDVDPEEAEWCLEILEECFEHFYIGPATSMAKKAALNAKLAAGGKPPAKG